MSLGATQTKEQGVKTASESLNDKANPETTRFVRQQKKKCWQMIKQPKSLPLHCGWRNLINKIYSNYVNWEQNINIRKKKETKVDIEH